MIGRLMSWFTKRVEHRRADEDDLRRKVTEEHRRLHKTQARADQVLADFHRAGAVVTGEKRGE